MMMHYMKFDDNWQIDLRYGQNFFISLFMGFFFRFRIGGTKKINKKALKMTN